MYFHNCSKTPETKELKTLACNYLKNVKIDNPSIKGTFKLENIRFYYSSYIEVDVSFEGEIKLKYFRTVDWFGKEVFNFRSASKIKINRKIKREIFNELRRKLRFFDISIHDYSQIKKIKWN